MSDLKTIRIAVTSAETITDLRAWLTAQGIDPRSMSCRREGSELVYEGVAGTKGEAVTKDNYPGGEGEGSVASCDHAVAGGNVVSVSEEGISARSGCSDGQRAQAAFLSAYKGIAP